MGQGRPYRKLKEVCCKITDGSHNPPKGIDFSQYRMISSQNVFDDKLDLSNVRYLTKESFDIENKRTKISEGDVLLTIVGTVGRSCVVPGDIGAITLQRSVAVITPQNIILPRFLMYCFRGLQDRLITEAHGIAQKGIYLKQLGQIEIPVPSIEEQKAICSLLDNLNLVIEKKKVQIAELDKLAQSLFYDMFGDPIVNEMGWNKQKFTDVCSIQYGYPFDSNYFTVEKEGLPLVRIRDVVRGYSETYFNGAYPDEYIVHKGDYLIGMDGEFNIAQWQSDNALLNQRVCKIRVKDNKCGVIKYISYFLIRQLKEIEDETPFVTVKHLSAKRINAIIIPVPPLPLQQAFAEKVEAIEQQKELINQSIKDVQTLFDAKMDYYFGD